MKRKVGREAPKQEPKGKKKKRGAACNDTQSDKKKK